MKVVSLLLAAVCFAAVSAKEQAPPEPANDKLLILEPFKVQGEAISSFAIDIIVYGDPATKKVNRIFIAGVLANTDAEELGLQRGDEIMKIDGAPVNGMDAPPITKDTQLGWIFLNRKPGTRLDLEVISRRPQKFTLRAGRELPGAGR